MIEICPSHLYRKEPEEVPEVDPPQGGAKWGYCYNHWCVNRQSGEIRRGRTLECDKWRIPTQDDFIELFNYVGNPDVCYKSTDLEFVLDDISNERYIAKASNLMVNDSAGKKLKSSEEFGYSSPKTFGGWRRSDDFPNAFGTNDYNFGLYPAPTRERKGDWYNDVEREGGSPADSGYGKFGMLWTKEEYVVYPLEHWIGNIYNGDIITIGMPVGVGVGWALTFLEFGITPIPWLQITAIILAGIVWLLGMYFYEYSVGGGVFFRYEEERASLNVKEGTVPGILDSNQYMFGHVYQRAGGGASIRLIRRTTDGWTEGEKYVDGSGKQYDTVKIGNQVWLASNLRTSKWKNGRNITRRDGDTFWFSRGESRLGTYSVHPEYNQL